MDTASVDPNPFIHVRMVLSMVVSLAIARLLSGFARLAQHPGRIRRLPRLLHVEAEVVLRRHGLRAAPRRGGHLLKGMPYLRAQAWWILRLYDVLG